MDFAWKVEKVALEFDGKTKYFDYRPTAEVIFEERRREKALTEDGWLFVRVEWKDLFREQEFKNRSTPRIGRTPQPLSIEAPLPREVAGSPRRFAGTFRRTTGTIPANIAGTGSDGGPRRRLPTPRSSVRAS